MPQSLRARVSFGLRRFLSLLGLLAAAAAPVQASVPTDVEHQRVLLQARVAAVRDAMLVQQNLRADDPARSDRLAQWFNWPNWMNWNNWNNWANWGNWFNR